jgi:hypothetical protein
MWTRERARSAAFHARRWAASRSPFAARQADKGTDSGANEQWPHIQHDSVSVLFDTLANVLMPSRYDRIQLYAKIDVLLVWKDSQQRELGGTT